MRRFSPANVAARPRAVKRAGRVIRAKLWTRMADDLDSRRRRAAYRANHRGTKEMDWVLGRSADAALGAMSAEALRLCERRLAPPDPDLRDMILPPQTGAPGEFADLIAALRSFHGLGG